MASRKQAKRNADDTLVMVSQRIRGADIVLLKRLGAEAQMPWGEVMRRVLELALPHVSASAGGIALNINGGRMK